jgi:hypothetical protein
MFPDLEAALGCKLPSPADLHTEEAKLALDRYVPYIYCLVTWICRVFGSFRYEVPNLPYLRLVSATLLKNRRVSTTFEL